MNVKQTLAAIRAIGLAATYQDGEWRVTFRRDEMPDYEQREEVAAYCYDNEEAAFTAQAMKDHRNNRRSEFLASVTD